MVFRLVVFLFQFVVPERVFLDPFVPLTVEDKVFHAIQQVDGSVVTAVVRRLQKRVESVDVLVIDLFQQNIFFIVLCLRILPQIPEQAVVFVRGQLGNADADLLLPLVAILVQFGQKHPRTGVGVGKALFYGKTIRLPAFLDELIVSGQNIGPVTGDDVVDLHGHLIAEQRPFGPLVPLFRFDLALGVHLGRYALRGNAGVDRGFAFSGYFGFLAKENDAESFSFHHAAFFEFVKLRLQHRNVTV